MSIPVTRPTLRRKDLNSVLGCLVSDRIGPGQLSAELATELSRQLGTRGGVCLSSYSAAIDRAFDLLELGAGDTLAISALAPSIYREVCDSRGVYTLIVDIDAKSPLLDAAALDRLLSSAGQTGYDKPGPSAPELGIARPLAAKPKALVLHYTLGFVPESDDILRLGIPVLEDVSHALGGAWNSGPCGSHGQVTLLSLHSDGIITAGEGAAVFGRDRKAARDLAIVRGPCDRDRLLPDMNAALGLTQLKELDRFLRARHEISAAFHRATSRSRHGALAVGLRLSETEAIGSETSGRQTSGKQASGLQGSEMPSSSAPADGVPYGFAVTVREGLKEVCQYASKRGIETRKTFSDAVLAFRNEEPWGRFGPGSAGGQSDDPESEASGSEYPESLSAGAPAAFTSNLERFPRAYELLLSSVSFPLYPALSKKDVQLIAKVLATLP
jgi:perosamine synthetase